MFSFLHRLIVSLHKTSIYRQESWVLIAWYALFDSQPLICILWFTKDHSFSEKYSLLFDWRKSQLHFVANCHFWVNCPFKSGSINDGRNVMFVRSVHLTWDELCICQTDVKHTDENLISQWIQSTAQCWLLIGPVTCNVAVQL